MIFAERLKTARKMMGMTQQTLAEVSGLPTSSIGQFETGAREPSLKTFTRVCKALRVSADFLLDIDLTELWRPE